MSRLYVEYMCSLGNVAASAWARFIYAFLFVIFTSGFFLVILPRLK